MKRSRYQKIKPMPVERKHEMIQAEALEREMEDFPPAAHSLYGGDIFQD